MWAIRVMPWVRSASTIDSGRSTSPWTSVTLARSTIWPIACGLRRNIHQHRLFAALDQDARDLRADQPCADHKCRHLILPISCRCRTTFGIYSGP